MRVEPETETAALVPWTDLEGAAHLTVVVKVAYAMRPGADPKLADPQRPIQHSDELSSDDPTASVRFESDLAPFKPRADIVLVGRAHPPRGRAVKQLKCSVRVGTTSKVVEVHGDRKWWYPTRLVLAPRMSAAEPFESMDLVYERAFGGIDKASARWFKENPIGTGFIGSGRPKAIHGRALPNVEDPKKPLRAVKSRQMPAGFGFYGKGCQPRLKYAGTYDERYRKERAPETPEDFSMRFWNAAHPDLQVKGYLRGDEEVELINVHPEGALQFQLPGVAPTVSVRTWAEAPERWMDAHATDEVAPGPDDIPRIEHRLDMHLDTLVFIPEEDAFYELFRGVFDVPSLEDSNVAEVLVKWPPTPGPSST